MRELHEKPEIWPFILLSLVLHAMIFIVLPRIWVPGSLTGEEDEVIAVELLPADSQKFRIADIEEPAEQKRPDKAKFLGMYDSSVRDETVGISRRRGSMGERGRSRKRPVAKKRAPSGAERIFAFDASLFDKNRKASRRSETPGEPGFLDDFYPDFKRGTHTYLNVLRYPGVAYFVRLKRAFKIAFNPEPALRQHFATNQIARGSVDVVLGVSVDRLGNLAELFIFRSSGIRAYDTEALRTVRVSSPFSSPPGKFVNDDGLLRMSWTFSVYL